MMRGLGQGVRIALAALRSNKLRTFLTLLGNIVGVTSVVAVVSLLDGMDQYMRREITSEGTAVFRIQQLDEMTMLRSIDEFLASLHNPSITLADAEWVRDRIPSADLIGTRAGRGARVEHRREHVNIALAGRSPEYADLEHLPLAEGRHLTELDTRHSRAVAVLGWDVAEKLFPGVSATGKDLRIDGIRFQVIGVVKDLGSAFGQSRNGFVIVPITTYIKRFEARPSIAILVRARSVELVPRAMEEARFAMRLRHRLRPGARDNFAVSSSQALLDLWSRISRAIESAIVGIVSISLVVGGIVIMNMMLVSVTERTREIGLRKALGARRSDVLWQFLIEAMTLSIIGGVIGVALGFGFASLISALTPLPYTVKAWAIAAALLVTGGIGLFFGLYPANRAARLDPIEALRYE